MNQRIRLILAAFIALSVIGLLVLILAHYRAKENAGLIIDVEKGVGVEVTGLHYSGTGGQGARWEMDAESARRIKGSELTLIQGIKAVFHSKDGMPYTLTAPAGRLREADGVLEVTGGVVLESDSGERLTTDSMNYSSTRKEITTDAPVTITMRTLKVTGVGLRVDLETGKLRILNSVKAVVNGVVS
ncbi:MAG: LPS export ABC transporter periplasmic protein LptC [Deltaproteobacteria bacterium]|nr:LPS export ABC transporter periplasmic protein LptC [Deltaproteobacteria bacterium]